MASKLERRSTMSQNKIERQRTKSPRPKSNYAASLRLKHNNSMKSLDVYKASSVVSKMRSRSKTRKKTPVLKVESPPPPPPPPPIRTPTPEPEPEPEPEIEPEPEPEPEPPVDPLEHFTTCQVCKLPFVDPKTLSCLHTFCKSCLFYEWPDCEGKKTANCPSCNEGFEVTNAEEELEPTPFVKRMIQIKTIEDLTKNLEMSRDKNTEFAQAVKDMECNCTHKTETKDGDKVERKDSDVENRSEDSLTSKDTDSTQPVKCDECSSSTDVQLSSTQMEERQPGICAKHVDNILDYFCSKCDRFICIECLITEHPHFQHGVSKVSDVAPRYKEVLGMLKTEAEYTAPELSRATDIYKDRALRTEEKLDNFKDKIRERKEEILREVVLSLDEEEKRLVDHVTSAVMMEKGDFEQQAQRLEDDLEVLKGYCYLTDNLITHANCFEVMETKTALIKRMHRICVKGKDPFIQPGAETQDEITMTYERGDSSILNKENSLGYLRTTQAFAPKSTAAGHGLADVMCGHKGVFGITTKDREGNDLEYGGAMLDMKIIASTMETIDWDVEDHDDGTYTVSYTTNILGPHIISVRIAGIPIQGSPFTVNASISENYNLRDEPLFILPPEKSGLSDPTAVATNSSNQIYVVDRGNNRIMVYSEKGEEILTIAKNEEDEDILQSPQSIAVTKSNKIIVSDTVNNQIQVFDKDGKFLHKFGQAGEGEGELKEPDGVAVDVKGNIVVADTMNHRIQIFRENGEFISTFGKQGTKEGELLYPSGVSLDKSGNVLVCDCGLWNEASKENNNRIQVFNADGKYQYEFGSTGQDTGQFMKPARVAVDKKGRMLVTDMDNSRIQVFKNNGTFLNNIVRRGKSDCFDAPCGIAVMQDGRIIITERQSNQIQIF